MNLELQRYFDILYGMIMAIKACPDTEELGFQMEFRLQHIYDSIKGPKT